jgi:hypothetical protein
VYAEFDGYQIWLATMKGHRIALEPPVFDALVKYQSRLVDTLKEHRAALEAEKERTR